MDTFVFVIPENEEEETGNETAFRIPATTQPSDVNPPFLCPPCKY